MSMVRSASSRVVLAGLLLLMSGAVAPLAAAQAPKHLALLTGVEGAVAVTRAGEAAAEEAVWGMQLFAGDKVETRTGAKATLLFADNSLVALDAGRSLVVSTEAAAEAGSRRPVRAASEGPLLADMSGLALQRTGRGEVTALGGLRSSGSEARVALVSPRQTQVRSARPRFAWSAPDGFDLFRVRVFDGAQLVWEGETDARTLTYPASAPALTPGTEYLWQVEGEELLAADTSPLVPFVVIAPEAAEDVARHEASLRDALDSDVSTLDFALGSYYARIGLLDEAIAAFEQIAARHKTAPLPLEILGTLYSEVGRKDDAIRAFRQALALGDR